MTQDDIIRMAKEADVWVAGQEPYQTQLNRFAQAAYAAGAAAEREECAKLADWEPCLTDTSRRIADAIRARGEVK